MDRKPHKCSCGGGGADRGDLETHILDYPEGHHEPVAEEDRTPLVRQHIERARRRHETRARLAEAAGVSLNDLREALR